MATSEFNQLRSMILPRKKHATLSNSDILYHYIQWSVTLYVVNAHRLCPHHNLSLAYTVPHLSNLELPSAPVLFPIQPLLQFHLILAISPWSKLLICTWLSVTIYILMPGFIWFL